MYEKGEKLIPDVYRKYAVFSGYIYGLKSFVDVLTDAYIYLKENKYLQYAKRPIAGDKTNLTKLNIIRLKNINKMIV